MTPEPAEQNLTLLLQAWSRGDERALGNLAEAVEQQLHRVAGAYLRREGPQTSLQPTALVNEAFVRLIEWRSIEWRDRAHFFAVAAKIMRRVLVSQAVARQCDKRGGSAVLVSLDEALGAADRSIDFVLLDEALYKLASFDERKSRIIELRFFGGLTMEETAEVLEMSERSVYREWDLARAWLFRELTGADRG
jgi:RNA polymerase sigma-70 factor (ECF subfamily)